LLAEAAQKGELSVRANPELHEGDYQRIITGFNSTLDAVIGPLNVAAEYVDRISKGDIPAEISDTYYGDFNEIKNNLNTCIKAVHLLVEDAGYLTAEAIRGELSTRADPTRHNGDFRRIVEGVNNTLDAVIGPLNVAAEYVDRISKGDIPAEITDAYYGDFNEIKNNLNTCIRAVNLLIEDAGDLTEAAVQGKLSTRADASRHTGDFRKIVIGVNDTLDAVIEPLHEAMRVSQEFAAGNFSARVDESLKVKGDFIEFKDALNSVGIELTRMMTVINEELFESVNVLSAASSEILSVTAELSSGTAQTATSVNETSATVEEVRKTTEMTNNKAKAVSEKSLAVSQVAITGEQSVEEILAGMTHIQQQMESIAGSVVKLSEQSQAIGEIIATVTDIAEQSNLLAVNASIEAAKAGEYGRGFGVVAQEIKNLAEQSKQATTHIRTILTDIQRGISSTVISTEQGTKTVATGLKLSNEARDAIAVLAQSVNEAARSSAQITASSQEQVVGMDQISAAMESIRMAAQNNLEVTRQVEKTAKDLHDLGIALKQITERFKL
jgi:methyl-accepting chemotaxis protein